MKNAECEYLLAMLVKQLRDSGAKVIGSDYIELSVAVEGVDDLLSGMQERLDRLSSIIETIEERNDHAHDRFDSRMSRLEERGN